MQGLLAAVADAEARREIEREQIKQGPGSEEEKECRLAELRAAHEHCRALHEARWVELHLGATGRYEEAQDRLGQRFTEVKLAVRRGPCPGPANDTTVP
jgi:hypothetical protein